MEQPPVALILDAPATGRANMERDEWLLETARPVVRLYGWSPACVSLGRTQTEAEVDGAAARRHGFDIVARKTGGGAILHNEVEVTYSVVLPHGFPGLSRDIMDSYRTISAPILAAFRALGVAADFGEGKGGRDTLCYLREEGVSIFAGGKKLSGGAQRRTQDAVLQHGTMVVRLDAARTAEVLKAPQDTIERKVTGLDVLGVEASRAEIVEAVVAAYEAQWGTLTSFAAPWHADPDWRPVLRVPS